MIHHSNSPSKVLLLLLSTLLACTSISKAQYFDHHHSGQYHSHGYEFDQDPAAFEVHEDEYPDFPHEQFLEPSPILDPEQHTVILESFSECKTSRCNIQDFYSYSTNLNETINHLGDYLSCVSSCAALEMLSSMIYLRDTVSDLLQIAEARLRWTHEYLAGSGDYDVINNRTRVEDSCCLPNENFVQWDHLMIAVTIPNCEHARMISVESYLQQCVESEQLKKHTLLSFECNDLWTRYLIALKRNVGHLVLAPSVSEVRVSPGDCNGDLSANPRAEVIGDVCVATEYSFLYGLSHHQSREVVDIPYFKAVLPNRPYHYSCPYDEDEYTIGYTTFRRRISYKRATANELRYYTITTGLPHELVANDDCSFTQGLASIFHTASGSTVFSTCSESPTNASVFAAEHFPTSSTNRYEYCNMQQYASYLQQQIFDRSECQPQELSNGLTEALQTSNSLTCLFDVLSMKSDCMSAVLQCSRSTTTIPEPSTIRNGSISDSFSQASQIFCGYVLCQKPSVYSLFTDQNTIQHASIMEALLEATINTSQNNSNYYEISPATGAFVMVVSVVVLAKVVMAKKNSNNQQGSSSVYTLL